MLEESVLLSSMSPMSSMSHNVFYLMGLMLNSCFFAKWKTNLCLNLDYIDDIIIQCINFSLSPSLQLHRNLPK